MNQFTNECRREWKRLGVPDPVADEMAADLAADLKEAATEGVSPEDVLGSAASDPRAFAASWAAERGLIPPRPTTDKPRGRSLTHLAIAALTVIAAIGAGLVIFASPQASAPTAAIRVPAEFAGPRAPAAIAAIHVPPPPIFASPRAPLAVWIKPDGSGVVLVQANGSGLAINKVGSILLIVGLVGVILSLSLLFWSSRTVSRRALFG